MGVSQECWHLYSIMSHSSQVKEWQLFTTRGTTFSSDITSTISKARRKSGYETWDQDSPSNSDLTRRELLIVNLETMSGLLAIRDMTWRPVDENSSFKQIFIFFTFRKKK